LVAKKIEAKRVIEKVEALAVEIQQINLGSSQNL
jgi:hypothetical protein